MYYIHDSTGNVVEGICSAKGRVSIKVREKLLFLPLDHKGRMREVSYARVALPLPLQSQRCRERPLSSSLNLISTANLDPLASIVRLL